MTIDPETLMAYADGELDPIAARRVERAMAEDPAFAAQVARHRALSASLAAHFAPIAAAPVPTALEARVRDHAKVVPIAPRPAPRARWIAAVAASLVLGVAVGQLAPPMGGEAGFTARDGALVASGAVASALDRQLASTQGDAPVRIGLSFRDKAGVWCRTFEEKAQAGIACREDDAWRVRRLIATPGDADAQYRQAASSAPELLQAVDTMIAGEPLDAAGEARAARAGWR